MGFTRVPVEVTYEHYFAGRIILQHVLQDMEISIGYEPKWVTCRINQSDTAEPTAFFLGWVENSALRGVRVAANRPDPGLFRFMDAVHGDTYANALKKPTAVLKQYWQKPKTGKSWSDALRLYQRNGYYKLTQQHEVCRLSVAVKANNRYVGTLNTGLSVDPGERLDNKLIQWAQGANSELVQYLRNEFVLGGPLANDATRSRSTARKTRKGA